MKLVDVLITTRQSVLQILEEIKDTHKSQFGWDRTRSNDSIRFRVQTLLQHSIQTARPFAIQVVTRHSSCGSANHPQNDYMMDGAHVNFIKFQDDRFEWTGAQIFQGSRTSMCPCSPTARATDHHQIDDLVIEKGRSTRRHHLLIDAWGWIVEARNSASSRTTRSSIREPLLRAVISLNDGILPQSVEDYIIASGIRTENC